MRIIDTDALINCINENDQFQDFLLRIEEAPTVMQWVSVEDELPVRELKVLVLTKRDTIPYSFGLAEHKDNGRWNLLFGEYGKVTHWMPLPPPANKSDAVDA